VEIYLLFSYCLQKMQFIIYYYRVFQLDNKAMTKQQDLCSIAIKLADIKVFYITHVYLYTY